MYPDSNTTSTEFQVKLVRAITKLLFRGQNGISSIELDKRMIALLRENGYIQSRLDAVMDAWIRFTDTRLTPEQRAALPKADKIILAQAFMRILQRAYGENWRDRL